MVNREVKNYAGGPIPNPSEMMSRIVKRFENIRTQKKYSFSDLFNEKKRSGKSIYFKDTAIWGKEIEFNNWDKKAEEELKKDEKDQREKNEVRGIYIFYENEMPIYVGISRTLIKRLKNHFLGSTHFQASLVYLILKKEHEDKQGKYTKSRNDLEIFKKDRTSFQEKMKSNWEIGIVPVEDNYELYMTEFYLACYLKTKWNSFATH